jgi:hypothetical protein
LSSWRTNENEGTCCVPANHGKQPGLYAHAGHFLNRHPTANCSNLYVFVWLRFVCNSITFIYMFFCSASMHAAGLLHITVLFILHAQSDTHSRCNHVTATSLALGGVWRYIYSRDNCCTFAAHLLLHLLLHLLPS